MNEAIKIVKAKLNEALNKNDSKAVREACIVLQAMERKAIDMGQVDVEQEAKINDALRNEPPAIVEMDTEESKVKAIEDIVTSKNLFDVAVAKAYVEDDNYDINECLNYIKESADEIAKDPEIIAIISTNSKILDMITDKKGEIKHYLGEILNSQEDLTEHERQVFKILSDTIDEHELAKDAGIGFIISILLISMLIAACKKIFK